MNKRKIMMGLERELAYVPARICKTEEQQCRDHQNAWYKILDVPEKFGGYGFYIDGGRMYVDCGHLELCSFECDGPYDLVRASRALDVRVMREHTSVGFFAKCNTTDGTQTFGAHESYSVSDSPDRYVKLLPFLATRPVIAGEGGVDSKGQPLFSARAQFMDCDTSTRTTSGRPLLNLRNEPHATSSNRLHLICGGDNMSDLSFALKFGTTAIAIILVEHGLSPAPQIEVFPTGWSGTLRGINVITDKNIETMAKEQTAWLEAAEAATHLLPEWAPRLLSDWRQALTSWIHSDLHLDWRIKARLFRSFINSRSPRGAASIWAELVQVDVKYGALANNGLYYSISDRLQARLPESLHHDPYVMPRSGRAKVRAALLNGITDRRHADCAVDWSVAYADNGSIFMPDPQSETVKISEGRPATNDGGCNCPDCTRARLAQYHANMANARDASPLQAIEEFFRRNNNGRVNQRVMEILK